MIRDSDNIRYIVQLLNNPGKEILASELQSIVSGIALDFNEEYSNKTEQEMNDEGMVQLDQEREDSTRQILDKKSNKRQRNLLQTYRTQRKREYNGDR